MLSVSGVTYLISAHILIIILKTHHDYSLSIIFFQLNSR